MTVQDHGHLIKRAAVASLVTATVLLLSKAAAWSASDSASVLSSLLDSLMDIAASLINFFAIRYALMPPDDEHPFGHSKAEGLAALMQSAFILGSATMLLLHVIDRLLKPQELTALPESIGVMAFSTLASVCLVMYQRLCRSRIDVLKDQPDRAGVWQARRSLELFTTHHLQLSLHNAACAFFSRSATRRKSRAYVRVPVGLGHKSVVDKAYLAPL